MIKDIISKTKQTKYNIKNKKNNKNLYQRVKKLIYIQFLIITNLQVKLDYNKIKIIKNYNLYKNIQYKQIK